MNRVLVLLGGRLAYITARQALRPAGRTVNRLVPRQPIDQLPPASHTAWVGVAPVANQQDAGGDQR